MIQIVVSVFDTKMDAYMQPWFAPTVGSAIRAFGQECKNPESILHTSPSDFTMYQLGTFDSETGMFNQESMNFPRLASADEFKTGRD